MSESSHVGPNAVEAELRRLRLFWTAVGLIGPWSTRAADVADAALFIESLGDKRKTEFLEELASFHRLSERHGVRAALERSLYPAGGADPDRVTRAVEAQAAAGGPMYVASRFADPSAEPHEVAGEWTFDGRVLEAGLGESVLRAQELRGTLDRSAFSGVCTLARPCGESWIHTHLGSGYDVRGHRWAFEPEFRDRLIKRGAVNSQTARWQELRSRFRLQRIDVEVEHWGPHYRSQDHGVVHRTSRTVVVKVIREHVEVDADVDLYEFGERAATDIYAEVFDVLNAEGTAARIDDI